MKARHQPTERHALPLSASGHAALALLDDPSGQFGRCYNRSSFAFRHGLQGHPLFEPSSLLALAARRPDDTEHAYWSNGSIEAGDRWENR